MTEDGNAGRTDFGVLLNLAAAVFVEDLYRRLTEAGFEDFSTRSGWVLRALGDEAFSLRDLAERMGLSSPGTLKAIDPMLKGGYLERVETSDKRVRAIRATARGRAALACATAFHAEFEGRLASRVGPADAAAARRALHAMAQGASLELRRVHHL